MNAFDEQAAGFFAAEGHFKFYDNAHGFSTALLTVSQKERFWLELLQERYGFGNVHPNDRDCRSWKWMLYGAKAEALYAHFIEQLVTWHWVVGFWEGDGSIGSISRPWYPTITFWNNDLNKLDVIEQTLGVGKLYPRRNGSHALYIFGRVARELVEYLNDSVLSPRRRDQLEPFVLATRSHAFRKSPRIYTPAIEER